MVVLLGIVHFGSSFSKVLVSVIYRQYGKSSIGDPHWFCLKSEEFPPLSVPDLSPNPRIWSSSESDHEGLVTLVLTDDYVGPIMSTFDVGSLVRSRVRYRVVESG